MLDAALQLPSFLEDGGGTSGVPISLGELHWLGNAAPPRALEAELSSSLHRGGPPGGRAAAAQKQFYLEAAKK